MTPIQSKLSHLEKSGLIAVATLIPEIEYLFRHALVQDAAYESLLRKDRRELHLAVGEALEHAYADRLDDLAAQLATHFEEAGQDQRALTYYTRAAQNAAQRYANAEAALYYAHAAEIARRTGAVPAELIALYHGWGRVLELGSRYHEAHAVYQELESLQDDPAIRLAAYIGQVTLYATPTPLMDRGKAIELAKAALVIAESLSDRAAEARLYWALIHPYYFSDQAAEALMYGEKSLALCRELNLKEQLAYTLSDLGRSYSAIGDIERTLSALEEASGLWREVGNLAMLTDTLTGLAEIEFNLGNYARSREISAESYRISTSTFNAWGQAHSLWGAGFSAMELGDLGQAAAAWQEGIRIAESVGVMSIVGMSTISLAHLLDTMGNPALALKIMETSLQIAEAKFPFVVGYIEAVSALAALHLGDLDEAERRLKHSIETINLDDYSVPAPMFFTMAQAEISMARGDAAAALALIDEQVPILKAAGFGGFVPAMLDLKAQALIALERWSEAYTVLNTAYQQAERAGARRMLWSILARLADLDARDRRMDDASQKRQQAREIVEAMAATINEVDARLRFMQQPQVIRLMQNTAETS